MDWSLHTVGAQETWAVFQTRAKAFAATAPAGVSAQVESALSAAEYMLGDATANVSLSGTLNSIQDTNVVGRIGVSVDFVDESKSDTPAEVAVKKVL